MKKSEKSRGTIVLIHGLLYRGILLWPMKRYLVKSGYRVVTYDYPSTRKSVVDLGNDFRKFLQKLDLKEEIFLVGHSMGGLLIRIALAEDIPGLKIRRCLMLGTPHHGSPVADYYLQKYSWSGRLIKSLPGLGTTYHGYPPLRSDLEYGMIVAGHDRVVPRDSVKLENIACYVETPYGHSGMLYQSAVWNLALKFLENGKFDL